MKIPHENIFTIGNGVKSSNDDTKFVTIDELISIGDRSNKLPCIFSIGGRYHIGLTGGIDDCEVIVGHSPFMDSFSTEGEAREAIVNGGAMGVVIYWV